MKKIIILIMLTGSIISCQSGEKSAIQEMKNAVLGIHDEAMPKMGVLRRTRRDLMLQADSLTEKDSLRASILDATASEIEAANEAMMDWMRNYEPDFEGTDTEILQYLEDQKTSITHVKEAMEMALAKGKEVLGHESVTNCSLEP